MSFYVNASFWITDPADWRFFPPFTPGLNANGNDHLGAEYFEIAKALVAGKGFSNPFAVESGPTAWMPPLYPFLLAGLLHALHSKAAVVVAVVILKNIYLVVAGVLVCIVARRSSPDLPYSQILAVYLSVLVTYFSWFFQITHDEWLIGLHLCLMYGVALSLWGRSHEPWLWSAWGVLGGFGALASPVSAMPWALITVILASRAARQVGLTRARSSLLIAAVAFVPVVLPWCYRNFVVLDRFIFIKSNLAYDVYQANYVSRDGIFDHDFLVENHPFSSSSRPGGSAYLRRGENRFLDGYRERLISRMTADPRTFLEKAINRLFAALLVYRSYRSETEIVIPVWTYVVHALPFISLAACLLFAPTAASPYLPLAATIYVAYLTPYIVCAYYVRYSLPLLPFKVLFILWFMQLARNLLRSDRADAARRVEA